MDMSLDSVPLQPASAHRSTPAKQNKNRKSLSANNNNNNASIEDTAEYEDVTCPMNISISSEDGAQSLTAVISQAVSYEPKMFEFLTFIDYLLAFKKSNWYNVSLLFLDFKRKEKKQWM